MGKWLAKFQKSAASQTDNPDIATTTSALSVPTLRISLENESLIAYFFIERAAIMECDGRIPKELAEDIAYLYTLSEFIRVNYHDIYSQFELILHNVKNEEGSARKS